MVVAGVCAVLVLVIVFGVAACYWCLRWCFIYFWVCVVWYMINSVVVTYSFGSCGLGLLLGYVALCWIDCYYWFIGLLLVIFAWFGLLCGLLLVRVLLDCVAWLFAGCV